MLFSTVCYVRIYPDRIVAKNLDSGVTAEVVPESPYRHERLLVGSISSAEAALARALGQVRRANSIKMLRLLLHPVAEFPGGVAEAEERLFRMMALDVKASSVTLWFGPELTDREAREKALEARP